jgi:predicted Zn-dependent protease with MMP-like domain
VPIRIPRERFRQMVSEELDLFPRRFRDRVRNCVVLIEDYPPAERPRRGRPRALRPKKKTMGVYIGRPLPHRSVFDISVGPDQVVLYQRNIESICRTEADVREQVRLTIIHELGHYFGLEEDDLWDV